MLLKPLHIYLHNCKQHHRLFLWARDGPILTSLRADCTFQMESATLLVCKNIGQWWCAMNFQETTVICNWLVVTSKSSRSVPMETDN